jgi:hypothetical protein
MNRKEILSLIKTQKYNEDKKFSIKENLCTTSICRKNPKVRNKEFTQKNHT